MAVDMLTWCGKRLRVSPQIIYMFEKLSISSAMKTKNVDSGNVHTVENDGCNAAQYSFTVKLNRQTGIDVYSEIKSWTTLMRNGTKGHLTIAGRDLFGSNFMLTKCDTGNVRISPQGVWTYAELSLTFQECYMATTASATGAGGSASSSGTSASKSAKSKTTAKKVEDGVDAVSSAAPRSAATGSLGGVGGYTSQVTVAKLQELVSGAKKVTTPARYSKTKVALN